MALTVEVLKANSVLAGLSDEQLAAITTLSANDENSVIAQKTGKIYGDLDADILSVTGIAKNGTEKTYDYAKRVLGEFKTKAESAVQLQSTIDTLTKEKSRLEKAIQDGASDAETAKALKQAKVCLIVQFLKQVMQLLQGNIMSLIPNSRTLNKTIKKNCSVSVWNQHCKLLRLI